LAAKWIDWRVSEGAWRWLSQISKQNGKVSRGTKKGRPLGSGAANVTVFAVFIRFGLARLAREQVADVIDR
jgi:hypothetical protein